MTTNTTIRNLRDASFPGKKPVNEIVAPNFLLKLFVVFFLCFGPFMATGQLSAGFTIDDTAGCAPMIVHFTNTSTGATSYSWNLGNGSPLSTFTNVSGTYTTAGIYTITLTAFDGSGGSSTYSATIHAYAVPTVSFSASDTAICPGTPVTFTSTSVPGAWGTLSYNWNFGDGASSTSITPVHTYASPTPPYYNVTLFATNSKGCINSLSKTPYIHVFTPAYAGFTTSSTYFCRLPATCSFTSTTIGTAPLSYYWQFGDGGSSFAPNPAHIYTANGDYTINLRVTDGHGCMDSLVYPNYITVANLTAAFTPVPIACLNVPVTFHNTSTTHISSKWYFGDGSTSIADSPAYAYTTAGTYTVMLVVYDGTCYDTALHSISISHPAGSFTITPAEPCTPPQLLTFHASVPAGCTVAWYALDSFPYPGVNLFTGFYNFGAGPTVTRNVPIVKYLPPGGMVTTPTGSIDSITMVITNSNGCKDTVGMRDTVNYLSVDLGLTGPTSGCTPLNVHFYAIPTALVYDPFAGPPWYAFGTPPPATPPPYNISYPYPYSMSGYSWNFGDGTPASTAATPVHTYTLVGGSYSFSCTLTTTYGCTAADTSGPVIIGSPPPTPTFTITPATHSCAGQPQHFISTATGLFNHYAWDYGDGNADTGAAPTHIYTVPGIYKVDLITAYNNCPSDHFYVMDSIDSPNAIINYKFDCIPRNQITFRDLSLGDNTHLWQFGDGTTSTADSVVHDYPSLSTIYMVTLTTYNAASGCRDTAHSRMVLSPLTDSLYPASTAICKNFGDSIKTKVWKDAYEDTTWATKFRWYVGGALIDSVIRTSSNSMTVYDDTFGYAFPTTGTIPVTLLLTDNHGCLDTFTKNILVAHPTDSFGYTISSTCAPVPIHLTDHSSDIPGATITSYSWSFGDGDTLTTFSPALFSHNYITAGTFTVEEIVTDNIGCKDTMVSPSHPMVFLPVASFAAYSTDICAGTGAHFINSSAGLVTSLWFFGDGDTSSETAPVHVYTAAGVYTVKLVVTGAFGCTDTATSVSYITVNPSPAASFYTSDTFAVCPPLNVSCFNTSTGGGTNYWTFGGITSSSAVSPSGVFVAPGHYAIVLYVTNSYGCTDSAVHYASLFGYTGAFTYVPVTGCTPFRVHFNAAFSSVTGIVWDFNDGITSSVSLTDTISHVYLNSGAYIPKLVLTDSTGCSSFSLGLDTIKADTLIPNFTYSPDPACQSNVITFTDASHSYFSTEATWLWTLAPGVTSTAAAPSYSYSVDGIHPVSLLVTDSLGCNSYIVKNVTVNPAPTAISGGASICNGTATALSDTIPGGVWSTASTIVSVNPVSGVVLGISTGTAVITYTLGLGCTATKTITVNAISSITGAAGICVGATEALTDPGGGTWSSSNTGIATVGSTGLVTGMGAGIATITYSLSSSCYTTTAVTVNPTPTLITGPAHVCQSGTATLSDTVGGGVWSITPTTVATIGSSSGIVSGSAVGTAYVTYVVGSGCTKHDTITVIPLPAVITGTKHACPGSTTTLADTTTGGIWSSSSLLVTIGSASGMVTGITTGTAAVTYTAGGCAMTTLVTVNPLPKLINGQVNICHGSTTTLSDTTTGGVWSSGSTAFATIVPGTGVVTGITLGSSVITYTLPTGCITTTTVSVYSAPAFITGISHTCFGTTTLLTDSTSGGRWSTTGSLATVGSATGIVTGGLTYGVAIITYSLGGTCYRTDSVIIDSFPQPISGATTICPGASAPLTDLPAGGAWSSSNPLVLSVGSASGIITGTATGTAIITYSLGVGCTTYSSPITVEPSPPAIIGPSVVCAGYTVLLHDPGTGGVWSSSVPATATISTGGLVSGGASSGTTVISYTATTGCAATLAMDVVKVPAITGITALCAYGATEHVSDSIPGGAWTAALVTITDSGIATSYAAGPATIYYTLPSGCFTSATLTVNPLPDPITGTLRLCTGLTTTLGDLTTGGVWSSGTTAVAIAGSSGLITGISPGLSPVTFTIPATGCTQTVTVTVSSIPSPISGMVNVCVGATTTLGDTSAGGIWSSGSASIAATGTPANVVTGVAAGVAVITYYLGAGCSVTTAVTVNPLPALIAVTGGGSYCAGAAGIPVGLAGSTSGVGYQLYYDGAPEGSAVAGSGGAISFGLQTLAGVYKVAAAYTATGCSSQMPDSATVTITPDVTPSVTIHASPSDTLCAGFPLSLYTITVNAGSAPVYQWSVNATPAGTDTSWYSYTPAPGDSVSVIMVSSAHCAVPDTVSKTIYPDVEPLLIPVVTITAHPGTSILTGKSDTLTASVTGSATNTYQWEVNGAPISGATDQTFINSGYASGDSVTCVVTSVGVCGGEHGSNKVTITVINNEGLIDYGQDDALRVVPNPNKGEFTITGSLTVPNGSGDEEVVLSLKDVLGQVVYKNKIVAHNGIINERVLLNSKLASGTYILSVSAAAENKVFHIVIEQ